MRIGIAGQYGFGNVGDEGILQAIMDSLGMENEYIINTSLPFTMTQDYLQFRIPNALDVRTLDDTRTDYDTCLYGGGKVDWGFGWSYFIRAFAERIPTMAYGIGFRTDQQLGHNRLYPLYAKFLDYFNVVTVRDLESRDLLKPLTYKPVLTTCPAINLKEERTPTISFEVTACPRYGDYNEKGEVDNQPQIEWFIQRLKDIPKDEIMLVPFHPKDLEGHYRDLELCQEISKRLGGGCYIFPCDGYNARKVKYAISRSKLVLSGGRYHAIVWAIAHGIPYEIAPTVQGVARIKLKELEVMDRAYGRDRLLEMEKENKKHFTLSCELSPPW